jgi:hypothetical protein
LGARRSALVFFTDHRKLADPAVVAAMRAALTTLRRTEPGLMQEVLARHTLASHLESH